MVTKGTSAGLISAALVYLVVGAQAAPLEVDIKLGDTVTGTLGTGGPDVVRARFYAVSGARVGITVTPAKDANLKPAVALEDAQGALVSLGKSSRTTKKGVKVRNFPVPAAGWHTFVVSATEGNGAFTALTAGKFPKKVTLAGEVPQAAVVSFELEPGSTFGGAVTAAKGASLAPVIMSITDRAGALVLNGLTASGGRTKFKSATTEVGGRLVLTVGGTGTGAFTAKLKVRVAKSRQTIDAVAAGRDPTTVLMAQKVATEPAATEWDDFAPLTATVKSATGFGSTNHVYAGEFNMTGSKDPLAAFAVDLRAAHDATNLYIRLRWHDPTGTNDVNRRRWYFNGDAASAVPDWSTQFGPLITAHPKATVEPVLAGWSSNLNDDKFAIAWPIGDPDSITTDGTNEAGLPAGTTFRQAGCAVACHGSLGMAPPSGVVDLWHWKTSRSNPLGYVNDQWGGNGTARTTDNNQTLEFRNRVSTNTSGPTKVLNPAAPNVTVDRAAGTASIVFNSIVNGPISLDGRLFLTDDVAMPIESTDAVGGEAIFAATCQTCHGASGKGVGRDFAKVGLTWTRAEIVSEANNVTPHGGGNQGLDGTITVDDTNKLIARIRAFAGVPGYTLSENGGVNFAKDDLPVVSNFETVYDAAAADYTLIVRRRLTTADTSQDVQFADLAATYLFGLAIMDFDGQNHAGAPLLELQFEQ